MAKREKVDHKRLDKLAEIAWNAVDKKDDGQPVSWSILLSGMDHDSDRAVYGYGFADGYVVGRAVAMGEAAKRRSNKGA
jgi:hypothetical protein